MASYAPPSNNLPIFNASAFDTEIKSYTSPLLITDGLVSAPSIAFANDTDTGLYSSASDNIDFATNGVNRMNISNSGIAIGTGTGSINLLANTTSDASSGFWTRNDGTNSVISQTFAGGMYYGFRTSGAQNITHNFCSGDSTVHTSTSSVGTWTFTQNVVSRSGTNILGLYNNDANSPPNSYVFASFNKNTYDRVLVYQVDGNLVIYNENDTPLWSSNTSSSDIRVKENIEPITNALDLVSQMNGVYFNYTKEHDPYTYDKKRAGVIAQEIEPIYPYCVRRFQKSDNPDDDSFLVDLEKIVPVLIESIKELKSEITELKNKLNKI